MSQETSKVFLESIEHEEDVLLLGLSKPSEESKSPSCQGGGQGRHERDPKIRCREEIKMDQKRLQASENPRKDYLELG